MATKKAVPKKAAPKKAAVPTARKPKEVVPQTIVVDFSDDTKSLIRDLIKVLGSGPVMLTEQVAERIIQPVKQFEEQKPVATPAPSGPVKADTVSLTMIREMINAKAGEGKTQAIVKTLGSYGAASASLLSEEHYTNFYNDLKEL